jgi:hypothetical protein
MRGSGDEGRQSRCNAFESSLYRRCGRGSRWRGSERRWWWKEGRRVDVACVPGNGVVEEKEEEKVLSILAPRGRERGLCRGKVCWGSE